MLRLPTIKRPPAHAADAPAMYIFGGDLALDIARFLREQDVLETSGGMHPLGVYWCGDTRFALDAQITLPEALRVDGGPTTVTVEDYVLRDRAPTRFEIIPVGSRNWNIASKSEAPEFEFARRGLVRVHDAVGADGNPSLLEPPRDGAGFVSAEWLDLLPGELVESLGRAVRTLSKNEVAIAEGKP